MISTSRCMSTWPVPGSRLASCTSVALISASYVLLLCMTLGQPARRRAGSARGQILITLLIGESVAVGEQFAAVVEHDDAVAQQAPALPGLVGHDPCGQMIGCPPSRAPRLVMTHGFPRQAISFWSACLQARGSARRQILRA